MRGFLPAFSALVLLAAAAGLNPSPAAPAKSRQVGVMESFNGTPWSHQDRIDMLEFKGGMGMTLGGQKRVRLALMVVDPLIQAEGGFSLAGRNYPLNPSTCAEVELN
jgi:hypothetical protein